MMISLAMWMMKAIMVFLRMTGFTMTEPELTIRPVQASDENEWRRLWKLYLEYYETELPEEIYQTTFSRILSDDPTTFFGMLALRGNQPIGLVHYVFHPSCWNIENVCYLQDLYVDKSQRGKSIGRALIEAVYEKADEAGCPDVYWMTQHFNEAGRRLYDRLATLSPFIIYER
jgi:GNAT superfamily N-acetyltransferase